MKVKIPHILNNVQYKVLKDVHRMILYSGGYGCGKTLLGCYWAILKALRNPGTTGNIMSPTIKMLTDNIIQPNLIPLLDEIIGPKRYRFLRSQTDLSVYMFNGSVIRLRAFDDEGKIRGADLNWLWLDEAVSKDQQYLTIDRFNQIRARLRKGDTQQFLLTTNPSGINHFLYKYFTQKQPDSNPVEDRSIHYGSIYDNKSLKAEYLRDMETTFTEDELRGYWVKNIGVIFHEFTHEKHVKSIDSNPDWSYYLSIDFGYTNPFVCLLIGVDSDNNVFVINEYYKKYTEIGEHCKHIQGSYLDKYDIVKIVADPEDPKDIAAMRRILKYDVVKASNRVMTGIKALDKLFRGVTPKGARITIDPICENLISELETYAWETVSEGMNQKERPKKFMDHGVDALRYFNLTIIENKSNSFPVQFKRY